MKEEGSIVEFKDSSDNESPKANNRKSSNFKSSKKKQAEKDNDYFEDAFIDKVNSKSKGEKDAPTFA